MLGSLSEGKERKKLQLLVKPTASCSYIVASVASFNLFLPL